MKSFKTVAAILLAAFSVISCQKDDDGASSGIAAGTVSEASSFSATVSITVTTVSTADMNKGKFGLLYIEESELGGNDANILFDNYLKTGEFGGLKQQNAPSVKPDGTFTVTLSKLHHSSKYYYAGFVELRDGSRYVGEASTFETMEFAPVVTTVGTGDVTFYTAALKGNVSINASDKSAVETGIVWAGNDTPSKSNGKLLPCSQGASADGNIEAKVVNLEAGTTYWFRAYVCLKETSEYFYGDVMNFTTKDLSEMAIDLGLSVLWASCNLGTEDPLSSGNRYKWGEITPTSSSSIDDYAYYDAANDEWENIGDDISGKPEYDAATATLGGKWRMPTQEEIAELLNLNAELVVPDGDRQRSYIEFYGIKGNNMIVPMVLPGGTYSREFYFVRQDGTSTSRLTAGYSGFPYVDLFSSTQCRYGINVAYTYSAMIDYDNNSNYVISHDTGGVWDLIQQYGLLEIIPGTVSERMFIQKYQCCFIRPVCDR